MVWHDHAREGEEGVTAGDEVVVRPTERVQERDEYGSRVPVGNYTVPDDRVVDGLVASSP